MGTNLEYNCTDDICTKITVHILVSQKRHVLLVETEVTSQTGITILRYSVTSDGLLINIFFLGVEWNRVHYY
jgi:hypothetical protein